ncbi:hypothetical protein C8R46DRAFT_1123929 [Mycena filopes]|nr:hypothetical protein C8R46DRAFT_1123929 [Mycena filopes]
MAQSNLKQTDDLWFPADVIILRAEENIFRVPKSILAARSSVFRTMFEIPQLDPAVPAQGGAVGDDRIDGIPVVRLHDSATDVAPFLRAVFDSSYFMPPPAAINFLELLGILKLSHKYDVGYLYKRAVSHLETVYPLGRSDITSFSSNNLDYSSSSSLDLDLLAIPALHRVGATWLLPTAYYSVGSYKAAMLRGEAWEQLPSEMKMSCLLLQVKQVQATHRIHGVYAASPETCGSRASCTLTRLRVLADEDDIIVNLDHDPFAAWVDCSNNEEFDIIFCPPCFDQVNNDAGAMLSEIWNDLPTNCGLPGWNVLLEQRRIALEL